MAKAVGGSDGYSAEGECSKIPARKRKGGHVHT